MTNIESIQKEETENESPEKRWREIKEKQDKDRTLRNRAISDALKLRKPKSPG